MECQQDDNRPKSLRSDQNHQLLSCLSESSDVKPKSGGSPLELSEADKRLHSSFHESIRNENETQNENTTSKADEEFGDARDASTAGPKVEMMTWMPYLTKNKNMYMHSFMQL